jgi:hypothetical protein
MHRVAVVFAAVRVMVICIITFITICIIVIVISVFVATMTVIVIVTLIMMFIVAISVASFSVFPSITIVEHWCPLVLGDVAEHTTHIEDIIQSTI